MKPLWASLLSIWWKAFLCYAYMLGRIRCPSCCFLWRELCLSLIYSWGKFKQEDYLRSLEFQSRGKKWSEETGTGGGRCNSKLQTRKSRTNFFLNPVLCSTTCYLDYKFLETRGCMLLVLYPSTMPQQLNTQTNAYKHPQTEVSLFRLPSWSKDAGEKADALVSFKVWKWLGRNDYNFKEDGKK